MLFLFGFYLQLFDFLLHHTLRLFFFSNGANFIYFMQGPYVYLELRYVCQRMLSLFKIWKIKTHTILHKPLLSIIVQHLRILRPRDRVEKPMCCLKVDRSCKIASVVKLMNLITYSTHLPRPFIVQNCTQSFYW